MKTICILDRTSQMNISAQKFLAERAVLEAVSSGLDGKVIRVGNLMSRNSDGEFQIKLYYKRVPAKSERI